MKAFKYAIVSAILALGIAAPVVSAQDAPAKANQKQGGGQRGGGQRGGNFDVTTVLLKGITLTAEQQTKVDAIKADTQKQVTDAAGDRTKMSGIRQAEQTKLREALTADQQKTFDENLKNMPQRPGGGNRGGNRPGKAGGAPKAEAE